MSNTGPDADEIFYLYHKEKMRFSQIAEMYGVSRQAIHAKYKRNFGPLHRTRPTAREMVPWKVKENDTESNQFKMLVDHAEFKLSSDDELDRWSFYKLDRLHDFYVTSLGLGQGWDLVIEFSEDIPANQHCTAGKWTMRTRTRADGDRVIRLNAEINQDLAKNEVWLKPTDEEMDRLRALVEKKRE